MEPTSQDKSLFQVYYYFYFLRVLPVIGGLFSSFSAYGYLPDSVLEFPSREDFKGLMSAAGFSDPRHFDLTFGIATVYVGKRGSRSKPCCCVDYVHSRPIPENNLNFRRMPPI